MSARPGHGALAVCLSLASLLQVGCQSSGVKEDKASNKGLPGRTDRYGNPYRTNPEGQDIDVRSGRPRHSAVQEVRRPGRVS